ncbi:LbetaH domain-containing protein [Acidimangrovimonas sediminis]|uniref:putative colanic acid biosynthesis acetyltransferase n=1 Tax=Acidimangrovimonas sediminis TaxID=2056283 RepID=UPI000C80F1AC|nr:putative colanic acid biosynthesis acetyltransferase [Acidimangrovimonas sediminis]
MSTELERSIKNSGFGGRATFSRRNRLFRLLWLIVWKLLASWTPPQLRGWRRFLLRSFGAHIHSTAGVRGSVRIWYPPHLKMGPYSSLGPQVDCYCQGQITIGAYAVVSQGAYLCTGTHDIHHPDFQLYTRPINIGANAWICADAFVGPGVNVGEGAVLGARGVAFQDLEAWSVYQGNPAKLIKGRTRFERPMP